MTDQEMLERAAKAAGNGAKWRSDDAFHLYAMVLPNGQAWSSLDDNGDALCLAVCLGFTVQMHKNRIVIEVPNTLDENGEEVVIDEVYRDIFKGEPWDEAAALAATRRAITMAAAMTLY